MILKFKKYSYGGEFTEYTVDLPKNTIIGEINQLNISYLIDKEKDIWTKDYIILTDYNKDLSTERFWYNSLIIKDKMLVVLSSIEFLEDYPITCLDCFPKDWLRGVYLKKFGKDDVNLKNLDYTSWKTAEYQELVNKYSNILLCSSKILGFTADGLKVVTVWFKGSAHFQDLQAYEVQVILYGLINRYKVYTNKESDKEFKDRVTEIINIAYDENN